DNILSRWFVIECDQTRGAQLKLKLHRDTVADFYDAVLDSPCFIEKAKLSGSNDLIFNSENMTYNQIKKKEILLKDETDTPWIVGYLAKNLASKTGSITVGANYDISLSNMDHDDWPYYSYRSAASALRDIPTNIKIGINVWHPETPPTNMKTTIYFDNFGNQSRTSWSAGAKGFAPIVESDVKKIMSTNFANWFDMDDIKDDLKTKFSYDSASSINTLLTQYDGKRVQFNDGIYRIKIKQTNYNDSSSITVDDGAIFTDDLYDAAKAGIESVVGHSVTFGAAVSPAFTAEVSGQAYYIEMQLISADGSQYDWNIPATRNKLNDAPYDMFAIPMNSVIFGAIPGGGTSYTQLDDIGKIVASDMAVTLSAGAGGELYDIQILPYCPMPIAIQSSNTISTLNLTEHADYEHIVDGDGVPVGIILFPSVSSFSQVIALGTSDRVNISDYKVESECDLYRLCSPNYAGVFEFNAAKNGGITYFEVNCTYKPYNPYIQLNPNFGRLYGKDFNDERGLICGGDFSMAIVNDAWVTYELQNKNYEKSFQRNITSLELQNKYATIRDVAGAVGGAVGAGASAATAAGPVGGVAAGAVSAAAGAADVYMNVKLRRENINLQKDQFSYSLQNIRALPLTLSRTTAYTINNKYFPFLEYYTCSDVEKEALRNKIKYEGMTVMCIGKIRDYLTNEMEFIKGRMIKIIGDDYYADAHISEEIYSRISQGIYIGGN
ncbi:MAG: hypothetical protein J6T10_30565, partial [Methanobrevibacter sp.]|nr:hypothetical protein [Methanobrevibacter sp.]